MNKILKKYENKTVFNFIFIYNQAVSEYEEAAAEEGYWSVCLDNQFSKFSAKMVNLYLTTFRYDEWEKFAEELQVRNKKSKARYFFLETKF